MKVGDLVKMNKGLIGIPKGTLGVIINVERPRPEVYPAGVNQRKVMWNNGRQRWVNISCFEVVSASR